MTKVASGDFEVASLTANQVRRLLRTLGMHRTMLQAGHEDASRLALQGRRPAYVLDFQLIFRYAFHVIDRPDWVSELEYLLDSQKTEFLIGPGTYMELSKFMHAFGIMIGDDGSIDVPGPSSTPDYEVFGLNGPTIRFGVFRINHLLDRGNVRRYNEVVENPEFDERSVQRAMTALVTARGSAASNYPDALNWVAVEHLRERAEADGHSYPYLLTATKPLIQASSWEPGIHVAVAREPSDAIYTEILLRKFENPKSAAAHTLEMALKAASLEGQLRSSPAFHYPEEFEDEPEWEAAIAEERVSEQFRAQLQELAGFVTDPIITETQRIYDGLRLASASAEQQRGAVLRELEESPRKLFDLIVEVDAALNADKADAGLADLWTTVLDMDTRVYGHRITYELFDRDGDRDATQYLAAECYAGKKSRAQNGSAGSASHEQYALRWPTSLDAETVVASFSRAFLKHNVETVDLVVGVGNAVEHFEATLPIALGDLLEAVVDGPDETEAVVEGAPGEPGEPCHANGEDVTEAADRDHRQLEWLRMGATVFDLYADIAPSAVAQQPVVGVFVDSLNPDHLQDLYSRTSARYLLPAWFKRAIRALKDESQGI